VVLVLASGIDTLRMLDRRANCPQPLRFTEATIFFD
jgi:hypothetical protein